MFANKYLWGYMKNLISAIQFITILPMGKKREYQPVGMIPYFPLTGLILGVLLIVFDYLLVHLWPSYVVSVLDVFFLVIMTGAFHVDGLGDAADGLFSHRPKEKMLEIMKDSRIGVMGLVAIICGLSVKWGGIASLPEPGIERYVILLIVPAYSRASMLFGIKFLEYGRKEGTGHDHFDKPLRLSAFRWLVAPIIISLPLGLRALWINICFFIVVFLIIRLYKKILGCITGDMLGAMTETSEALLFLLASICFV